MRISPRLRGAATLLIGFTAVSSALLTLGSTTPAHAVSATVNEATTTSLIPCADKDGDPDDFCPAPTTMAPTTLAPTTSSPPATTESGNPPIVTGCIGAGCNAAVTPTVVTEVTPTTLASGGAVLAAQGTTTPSGVLASTGAAVGRDLAVAFGLVLCGFGLLGLARRRDRAH